MRRTGLAFPAVVSLAMLAVPVAAAAPTAGPAEVARERYRGQGMSACLAELRRVPGLSPDDLEGICGCALDGLMRAAQLPPMASARFRSALDSQLVSCTFDLRPDRMGDIMTRRITVPEPRDVPEIDAKPTLTEGGPPAEEEEARGGGFDLWAWLGGLGLPAWLTGLSIWSWVAIGLLVFGLLGFARRRRDDRDDLTGPPPSMRRGAPPAAPRRPDLPR